MNPEYSESDRIPIGRENRYVRAKTTSGRRDYWEAPGGANSSMRRETGGEDE